MKTAIKGQRYFFQTADLNDIAALVNRAKQQGTVNRVDPGQSNRQPTLFVRNSSGEDAPRHGVLSVSGIVISPDDNEPAFEERPVLDTCLPDVAAPGAFVITHEPIADGAIGRAYTAGTVPVRVLVEDEAHGYADVGDTVEHLVSCAGGAAQILWLGEDERGSAGGDDIRWAVIRFPSAVLTRLCRIVTEGPESADDYTDHRYWLQGVVATDATFDTWTSQGDAFTAVNLAELNADSVLKHHLVRDRQDIDGESLTEYDPDTAPVFVTAYFVSGQWVFSALRLDPIRRHYLHIEEFDEDGAPTAGKWETVILPAIGVEDSEAWPLEES
jgi:hypothetical protein